MIQTIYSSAAVAEFKPSDLETLLDKARANNQQLGVGGMLLYDRGSFLQVLEGPEPAVAKLFAKIGADARHERVVLLLQVEVEVPVFAEWSMGFVSGSQLSGEQVPGYSDFLKGSSLPVAERGAAAARVLTAFRDGRFRTFVE